MILWCGSPSGYLRDYLAHERNLVANVVVSNGAKCFRTIILRIIILLDDVESFREAVVYLAVQM